MPYIKEDKRTTILEHKIDPHNAGELNFLITHIINCYFTYNENGFCYQSVNDAVGALECAKLELYRRLVAGYEDQKIEENGEVYFNELLRKANG